MYCIGTNNYINSGMACLAYTRVCCYTKGASIALVGCAGDSREVRGVVDWGS